MGHGAAITAHMFLGPGLMKEPTTYYTSFETYQQVNIAAFRAQRELSSKKETCGELREKPEF